MKNLDDYQQKVAMLERKVLRQTKARKIAEQQLEKVSLEIYKTNKVLATSLSDSQKRARDLAFLHEISLQIVSEKSLEMMILSILPILCDFTNALYGIKIDTVKGKILTSPHQEFYNQKNGWIENHSLANTLFQAFDSKLKQNEGWQLCDLDDVNQEKYTCAICVLPSVKQAHLSLFLVGTLNFVSEQKLYVLNTAKAQLLTGLKRRINEASLKRYNNKLETVLTSLRETQNQLIQSEKMASLGQLAAGVAHEINNPLGYVRANLQVLSGYMDDLYTFNQRIDAINPTTRAEEVTHWSKELDIKYICEDAKNIISTNLDGINRVSEIVQTLKNFSHTGEEKFESLSLTEVINASLIVVSNQLKYQHKVLNQLPDNIPPIMGSYNQLQQVFINFFVNAAQAMPNGGELSIYHKLSDTHLTIAIKDTGIGMDEDTKNKIFTPFYTTKAIGEGTGLGMSVSYAILEKHKASVSIESTINKGTTFFLQFELITS